MRLPSMLASLFLITSITPAFAQVQAVVAVLAPQSASVTIIPANGAGCPVSFSASRLPNGGMLEAGPTAQTRRPALHVAFSPLNSHLIVQADITLHGIAGRHVIPAGQNAVTDTTETFSVSLSTNNRLGLDSVIYPHKLTGVLVVELNSLTYADGTRWHASAQAPCRITPDSFQMVAAFR